MPLLPLIPLLLAVPAAPALPSSVWMEAEHFGPLKGSNFSFMPIEAETRGSWSLAGPDAAAAWTQGGESEFMSIAARADEPGQLVVSRNIEIPAAGDYTLWVRYADYRLKQETFGVRIIQGSATWSHVFGQAAIVDELDPMKLLWDWSYAWDHAATPLRKGPATVELYTTGPTGARRCIDCLCLTTNAAYHPTGREKPTAAAWLPLRAVRAVSTASPLVRAQWSAATPPAWKISPDRPTFLWNTRQQWLDELKKTTGRVDAPFNVDPPLLKDFLALYAGKTPPVYGHPLSGPAWHIPFYPEVFSPNGPFLQWLDAHPDRKFAFLLNYAEPAWPKDADRAAVHTALQKYGSRFLGFVAGENISYDAIDNAALEKRVQAAKSRADVLAALRDLHTIATQAEFAGYFGAPVSPKEAWAPVISCLSAGNEAFTHALCDWGVRRIGHENSGNSPTLARRLAFLRGAARQFGARIVDYQSDNLGDSSTMFSREAYFYPASSRYIFDNQYDAWAGAGTNWLLKDYLLWYMAGVDAYYDEEGEDLFWKPGGGSAGDNFPVQLSPKGKIADVVQRLAENHPRGDQYTPIAFLVDEAHGWSQESFQPGAFGLDPQWNPAVLAPGRHEASLRGLFDIAYYPAPETQNEPANSVRQTYVNGIFGDIFDVIAAAPGHTSILSTYPVTIVAGEVPVNAEWGAALRSYVRDGGTFVYCADQLAGPDGAAFSHPSSALTSEASSFTWTPTGETIPANVFRYTPLDARRGRILAAAPNGSPLVVLRREGKGQWIEIGVPLGLGIDNRPIPILSLLMRSLAEGLVPVKVTGDVEWTLNRLDDGGWLLGILNNRGVGKPQHGVLPTDFKAEQPVTLHVPFKVARSSEWLAGDAVEWNGDGAGAVASLVIPAGAVRLIAIYPAART